MTRVTVERYVEQVVDGLHYKGYTQMGGVQFDYEVQFTVPIDKLDDKPCKTEEEVRQVFRLSITKGGREIELDKDEYGFFFKLLVEFVVQFYNHSKTRASNEGDMGAMLMGMHPLSAFGASVSIGISNSSAYNFPPNLCAALSAPKFGCAFPA